MREKLSGPFLIMVAALLWGTDSLFRSPAVGRLDPTFMVFIEHLWGILPLIPWMWSRHRGDLFKLGPIEWIAAVFAGAGGGAIATVLFTASFRYLNPSVTILLQKLQPVMTVLLAYVLLGERPAPKFYPWAAVALAAGFLLSFPDLDVSFLSDPRSLHAKGVIYALSAAGLWSLATVAGRKLLLRASPAVATWWRYVFGLATLCFLLTLAQVPMPALSLLASKQNLITLAYLSFVTGIIPMLAYYNGLARTPAAVTAFIELLYPVSAVILNTVFLDAPLSHVQLAAGGVLLLAVTLISI